MAQDKLFTRYDTGVGAPWLVDFQEEVNSYWQGSPVNDYLRHLSPSSKQTMQAAIEDAARILTEGWLTAEQMPWHRLKPDDMLHLKNQLSKVYAPATGNRILSAVRGILKSCIYFDYIPLKTHEYYQFFCHPKIAIRGERLSKRRLLTPDELTALFQVCTNDLRPAGRRDRALLALLHGAGLRCSEVVSLNLDDYRPASRTLVVQAGRPKNERRLVISESIIEALREWVIIRGRQEGPLFRPISKSGKLQARRLTNKAVTWILHARAAEAGIRAFTPHDVRRTYISSLLASGKDLATVTTLVGHRNVLTTARYAQRTKKVTPAVGESTYRQTSPNAS